MINNVIFLNLSGLLMLPVINSALWEAISERPSVMVFAGVANLFLILFASTPLLLHFLTKRFVQNLFYNSKEQVQRTKTIYFFLKTNYTGFHRCSLQFLPSKTCPSFHCRSIGKIGK